MWFTSPVPDSAIMKDLYASGQYRDHAKRFIRPLETLIRFFRGGRLRGIKRFCKRGRMLDIGCGRGLVLARARDESWDTAGMEFSDDTARQAREVLGLDIRTGRLEDAGFTRGSFDVITIWHVLEHLPDPEVTLRTCYSLLKPGGLLAVAVPNSESLQSRITGRHWFHLDVPYHLYHYSCTNLSGLLERLSFHVKKTVHFSLEQNPFGFLQSMLNMTGLRHNLLYDFMRTKSLRKQMLRGRTGMDLVLTFLILPVFTPIAIGLSVLEALACRGGTVAVYAIRSDE